MQKQLFPRKGSVICFWCLTLLFPSGNQREPQQHAAAHLANWQNSSLWFILATLRRNKNRYRRISQCTSCPGQFRNSFQVLLLGILLADGLQMNICEIVWKQTDNFLHLFYLQQLRSSSHPSLGSNSSLYIWKGCDVCDDRESGRREQEGGFSLDADLHMFQILQNILYFFL